MRRFLRERAPLAAALLVLFACVATVDERSFGLVPDGREMLSAATALARFGELGVSRDFVNAVPRPGGDAFSRYGTGTSLAEVPFLLLARALPSSASSAPLLVLLPILSLAAVAWGVARALRALGASPGWQLALGAGSVLATPLFGYAPSDYGEPLGAALAAVGLAAVAAIRLEGPTRGREAAAGLALGALLLVKSLLLVVALPLLAAAALPPRTAETGKKRRAAPAARPRVLAWAALPAALWLALELVRFGRLLGGYGGETFTYPLLAGLLRLTLFPNKGLLVYAPAVLLSLAGLGALVRRDRALSLAIVCAAGTLFAASAAWWAWDGQAGWGPRLVLPAVPLLIAAAAPLLAASRAARLAAPALLAAGFLVNLPGALQPFAPVYALATAVPPQPISEARARGTQYEIYQEPDGTLRATGPHHLSLTPSWAPPRIHALLLLERMRGGDVAARLASAGLDRVVPPFRPAVPDHPGAGFAQGASAFGWPFWGRSWVAPLPAGEDPLAAGLTDQLVRAMDLRLWQRAGALGDALLAREGKAPRAASVALAAEAAELSGRAEDSARLLARADEPCHPWILFVKRRRGENVDACLPPAYRAGFLANVDGAQRDGAPLTAWARAALQAQEERGGPSR